jgi:hypothetical protein
MIYQVKHFHDSFPHRFALECLFDRHALDVPGLYGMSMANHILKFFDVGQAASSLDGGPVQNLKRKMPGDWSHPYFVKIGVGWTRTREQQSHAGRKALCENRVRSGFRA